MGRSPRARGTGPGFRCPVLIVQGDALSRGRIATVVCYTGSRNLRHLYASFRNLRHLVPLTSNVKWAEAPGDVLLSARQAGLPKDKETSFSKRPCPGAAPFAIVKPHGRPGQRPPMTSKTSARRVRFTYEDYTLLPEDGRKREIIDGELYGADIALPRSPSLEHQRTAANLLEILNAFARSSAAGTVVQAPFDVFFSNENIVQP